MPTPLDYIINANQGIENRLMMDAKNAQANRLGVMEMLGKSKIQTDKDKAASILQAAKDASAAGKSLFEHGGGISPIFSRQTGAPVTPQDRLEQILSEVQSAPALANAKTRAETAHQRASAGQTEPVGTVVDTSKNPKYLLQGLHPLIGAEKMKKTETEGVKDTYVKDAAGNRLPGPSVTEETRGSSTTTQGQSGAKQSPIDLNGAVQALKGRYPSASYDEIRGMLYIDQPTGELRYIDPATKQEMRAVRR